MSHIYHDIYCHLVWGTKNREGLLTESVGKPLRNLIQNKVNQLGGILIDFNTYKDHCHSLTKIPLQISVSDFVGQAKGYSAFVFNKVRGTQYLRRQQGFGVLSLSRKGVPFCEEIYSKPERTSSE